MKRSTELTRYAAFAGVTVGLAIGTAWGERDVTGAIPSVAEMVAPATDLDPFRNLTHAGMLLAAREASASLEAGRPWAAWNRLRDYVGEGDDAPASVTLLAARAAAGWDGWSHVRRLLAGREWLAKAEGGEGLLLLARAEEARSGNAAAAALYRRYATVAEGERRGVARARLGRVLREAGEPRAAADAFAAAAGDLPAAADWLRALQAESLAKAGDPAATSVSLPSGSAPALARRARAEASAWNRQDAPARAADALERAARALAGTDPALAAELANERADALVKAGREAEARDLLRRVALDTTASRAARTGAARRLGELPGERTAEEELARAAAYEAGEKPGLAAKALRAAVSRGAADDGAARLRIARLLFEARDFAPARIWAERAAETAAEPEALAEAELIAARALVRSGKEDAGMAAIRAITERRAGTAAAGTAWFLRGDAASDRDAAIAHYRRAAAVAHAPDAREALFRVGDRLKKAGDPAGAAKAWEEYAARFPRGEATADVAYQAGLLHERAGRSERARAMYEAAIAADPVAYSAIRAADRLGADPLARAVADPRPWIGLADDAAEARTALARLKVLGEAGLDDAWKDELAGQTRRLDRRHGALLALAEGLRDSGHTVEAIRLGRDLLAKRGGAWDARLLRVVFPFPYRELLLDEAERVEIEPWLLAGLVRQESSFNPEAQSWVGARGLSQIMPATGAWLAPGVGVRAFAPELLNVPEINLRMGARYLRDQLKRYRGARDLALAAYNAGPSRADRWKRELGYGRDVDAFRDKIPFDETRHYVKVVIRNAEVYRRLYGPDRSPGLVADD